MAPGLQRGARRLMVRSAAFLTTLAAICLATFVAPTSRMARPSDCSERCTLMRYLVALLGLAACATQPDCPAFERPTPPAVGRARLRGRQQLAGDLAALRAFLPIFWRFALTPDCGRRSARANGGVRARLQADAARARCFSREATPINRGSPALLCGTEPGARSGKSAHSPLRI